MSKYLNRIVVLIFVALLACSPDPDPRPIYYYEDDEKLLNFTAQQLKDLFNAGGASFLASMVEYEIVVYRFYYKTTYKGQEITASGLLSVPVTEDPLPMVSFQHGTIIDHDDAPTIDWPSYQTISYFSSTGYILAIPDYIGFGSSDNVLHPYYVAEAYASAITDMLKAAEEFVYLQGGNFNGEVFLAGYSEGGYATMAAHKEMEENPIMGMELVASAPASGGYDVMHMLEYFLSLDTYDQPFFLTYVMAAYKDYYFDQLDFGTYFQEPYATDIPNLITGQFDGNTINNSLTDVMADLLQPGFIEGAFTDPAYADAINGLEQNDLSNWVPEIPMYLYHGTADVTVPYENSVITYDKMIENGASPDVVTFTPLQDEDHYSGGQPYFFELIQLINSLK